MIDGINRNSRIEPLKKKKGKKSKTSTEGNIFSQILDVAEENEVVSEAEEYMEKVDDADRKLRENPNFENLEEYKKIIKKFVEDILHRCLKVKKKRGKLGNRTKVYMILEKVDDYIDDMEEKIKNSIDFDIAEKLDEIRGILVDIYS